MELKAGYKQTELGVIPKDWEVKKLGDIGEINNDNLNNRTRADYTFNYIALESIEKGKLKNTIQCNFRHNGQNGMVNS